ncbi:MAG: hypothetical protein ABIY70_07085 [Capsulimonas sp.]|uniref:hypothetical protein n=1 Tax=Capsulimonas sp. TaxID=2494211 RepID=UPI003264377E
MKTQRAISPWTAFSLFAVPLALVVGGAAAHADAPTIPHIGAQIGLGYLSDSSARDAVGNGGLHAGLSFVLPGKSLLSTLHGTPSIDVDYNHTTGHGGHADALGFTYTERISLGNNITDVATHGARPYVGLGIGAFRTDVRHTKTTTTTTPGSSTPGGGGSSTPGGSNTGTQQELVPPLPPLTTPGTTNTTTTSESGTGWTLGGKILAGVDFGTTFVEASYIIAGSQKGVRADSYNLSVGVHF